MNLKTFATVCVLSVFFVTLGLTNSNGQSNPDIESLIKFAELGDVKSQLELARTYLMGRGTNQDYVRASKWFEKAANQGNAAAQYYLGLMYRLGAGNTQNVAVAAEWYRKAAYKRIVPAQFDLGVMYLQGNGVPQNYAEAANLLSGPAEHGNTQAHCILGAIYSEGKAMEPDNVQAYKWLSLCAASGNGEKQETAAKLRDEIAKHMQPEQKVEAQKIVEEWKPAVAVHPESLIGDHYSSSDYFSLEAWLLYIFPDVLTSEIRDKCLELLAQVLYVSHGLSA